jgi:hypothetical protein
MDSDIDFHQYRIGDCSMLVRVGRVGLTAGVLASLTIAAGVARAQQTVAAPQPVDVGPRVNDVAPGFTLAGATRYGLLNTRVSLADYRGRTVVLAFFFKARTKG